MVYRINLKGPVVLRSWIQAHAHYDLDSRKGPYRLSRVFALPYMWNYQVPYSDRYVRPYVCACVRATG